MTACNVEIAAVFDEMADLLEIDQENPFRIRAYRNAARLLLGIAIVRPVIWTQRDHHRGSDRSRALSRPCAWDASGQRCAESRPTSHLRYRRTWIPAALSFAAVEQVVKIDRVLMRFVCGVL
jgi:hypothetical protein